MANPNQTTDNHFQLDGNACIDHWTGGGKEGDAFYFSPNVPQPGMLKSLRRRGTGQLSSDGTFEFVSLKDHRSKAKLIKKMAHGRLSETQDGGIQLTLKVYLNEHLNIGYVIMKEAAEAVLSLSNPSTRNC